MFISVISLLFLISCQTYRSNDNAPKFPESSNIATTTFWVDTEQDPLRLSQALISELSNCGVTAYAQTKSEQNVQKSRGTGFAISSNLIITNSHVVGLSETVKVQIGNNNIEASVIINEPNLDLAVLKTSTNLPYSFTVSDDIEKGEQIFVLGYPYTDVMGDESKIMDGIVNSNTGMYNSALMFQFSADIQSGNSGSPIFDNDFNVIGIASSKLSDLYTLSDGGFVVPSVNYAIKSDFLKYLVKDFGEDTSTKVNSLENAEKAVFLITSEQINTPIIEEDDLLIKFSYTYDYAIYDISNGIYYVDPLIVSVYTTNGTKILEIAESSYRYESAHETAQYAARQIFYAFADIAMPRTNNGEKPAT